MMKPRLKNFSTMLWKQVILLYFNITWQFSILIGIYFTGYALEIQNTLLDRFQWPMNMNTYVQNYVNELDTLVLDPDPKHDNMIMTTARHDKLYSTLCFHKRIGSLPLTNGVSVISGTYILYIQQVCSHVQET